MKIFNNNWMLVCAILVTFIIWSCKEDEPQPQKINAVTFNLKKATHDGNDINPLPNYSLTINFDDDGNITGFTSSSGGNFVPTPATSGTLSVGSSTVTFKSGSEERLVTVKSGSFSTTSKTVVLSWELTKIDDGVEPIETGTYEFTLNAG